jgi:DNA polymerase-1
VSKTWLLIDAPNLAWRSFHTLGTMAYQGRSTGTAFGLLRDWLYLARKFDAANTVWCFDRGRPLRALELPGYKAKRKGPDRTPEELEARSAVGEDIDDLYRTLPRLGFSNVFAQEGYEADDLIAACAGDLPAGDRAVVVSTDKDLLQLIGPAVDVFNLKKLQTLQGFFQEYGIRPHRWAEVKAIAGCPSDEVPGVGGVAEKSALRYLRGELPLGNQYRTRIERGRDVVRRNLDLVRLPYAGCRLMTMRPDALRADRWEAYCRANGYTSLLAALGGRKERTLFDGV